MSIQFKIDSEVRVFRKLIHTCLQPFYQGRIIDANELENELMADPIIAAISSANASMTAVRNEIELELGHILHFDSPSCMVFVKLVWKVYLGFPCKAKSSTNDNGSTVRKSCELHSSESAFISFVGSHRSTNSTSTSDSYK